MWVRISDRETINVDAKVVKLLKEDLPLREGKVAYYIGFYETLAPKSQPTQQFQFDTVQLRDQAFETINQQLSTIDIRVEK